MKLPALPFGSFLTLARLHWRTSLAGLVALGEFAARLGYGPPRFQEAAHAAIALAVAVGLLNVADARRVEQLAAAAKGVVPQADPAPETPRNDGAP